MVEKELLKEIVIDQRAALLEKDLGIPRSALSRISEVKGLPHIVVISGIRRCGKSTLLRQIVERHYNDEDFFYINFEDERLRDFHSEKFNELYEVMLSLYGKKNTILIDEVQNVEGFEFFVRRFYDQGFKFFITGSNANLLSREMGTKLTGRYVKIDLQPFSFIEYLDYKGIGHNEVSISSTESRVEIRSAFDEYLEKGGMPEYIKYGDQEILMRTYEDIVLKDIVVRYGLENVRMIKDLYGHLISNLSNKFTFNSLRKIVGAGSTTTIQNYIHYLEEANFCVVVNKYEHSIKKQINSSKKFYLTDHGFLRPISTRLTKDRGRILENIVLEHLRARGDVFYYEDGNECDFVLVEGNEVTKVVQSTWILDETTRGREIDGLVKGLHEFNLKEGTIVTYDNEEKIDVDGRKIKVIPAWKWLISGMNDFF